MNPAADIPACNSQSECFAFHIDTRMTDTLDTDLTHLDGTDTTFSIPTSGYVGSFSSHTYDWIIDWGDNTTDAVSDTGGQTSAGITHSYATFGEYQITIRPNVVTPTSGWLNAFGFYNNTTGANTNANKCMFLSVDTPFTQMMRTPGASNRFSYILHGTKNGLGIPTSLFASISTIGAGRLDYMFQYAFDHYAFNSTTATIPDGLFDHIDTSSATNLYSMFKNTFSYYAFNSTTTTIPDGLFDPINTTIATNLGSMFSYTFQYYAFNSTTATIPDGLFNLINSSNAIYMEAMFSGAFDGCAYNSTTATIPDGLFDHIDTSSATTPTAIFSRTFHDYAYSSNSATIPAGLFNSIRTSGATNLSSMFNGTFWYYAYNSTKATIPNDLFSFVDTSSATIANSMFQETFKYYAYNSTIATTIPSGLFDSIDISGATNLSSMFNSTFYYYAYNSTVGTIPSGLFDSVDTSGATNLSSMFGSTFYYYASNSTVGTIPSGLFDSINTSSANNLSTMFSLTFGNYAYSSTIGTIPSGLFDSVDTSGATNLSQMFFYTFSSYSRREAQFVIDGSVVATSSVYYSPYSVRIGLNGTPSRDPTVVAGDKIYPAYFTGDRKIIAPAGYASFNWYREDGTSCAVINPTADCGVQDDTTLAVFPNATEWTPDTSTEKGSITFYGVLNLYLSLYLYSDDVVIGGAGGVVPTLAGVFGSATNVATVATNNPTGYNLSLSTDQPNSAHASDMAHQSLPGNYLPATSNVCTWSTGSKTFTNTTTALSNNTYGFTLTSDNLTNQKLCQIPNSTSPLTVKSTTSASPSGNATTIYYGAKINLEQLAGQYKTTVVYTVLANP
jgi:hypothetical protein